MKKHLSFVLVVAVASSLGAAVDHKEKGKTVSKEVRGYETPSASKPAGSALPTAASAAVDDAYRVGPKDVLSIEVLNRTTVEYERREYTVDPGGTVYLPLLSEVKVAELTVPELTTKL